MGITSTILPEIYLITPEPGDVGSHDLYLKRLEKCLKNGVRLVQFRAKTVPCDEYGRLAESVASICSRYGAALLLNSRLLPDLGGMHLTSAQLDSIQERPKTKGQWLAASCHNQKQIEKANEIKASFVVVSPVKETSSHPESVALGWPEAARLSRLANMPVYALGGMGINDIDTARRLGMQGIAAISSLWFSDVS